MSDPFQNTASSPLVEGILERITDAFVALDKHWRYTYMNKKAGQIFNRDPNEMIGKHIWTEFPEGIGQPFHKAYEKAMEEQQYVYLEEYYAPYDLWFENHIYPSPEGLSIFFRDITGKKKADEALKRDRMFIESIINASPDIIYIYDIEERRNVFVNEGIQKNLGYSDEEIKQMGEQVLPTLMHPEDFDSYLRYTYPKYSSLADKELLIHEFRMKDKNKAWHWLYCKESVFLRNADGSPKQIFGVSVDISEKKNADEKIKESTNLLQSVFDASIIGVSVLDAVRNNTGEIIDFRYRYVNRATEKMNERTDLVGKNYSELHSGFKRSGLFENLKAVVETGQPGFLELFYNAEGFENWFNTSAVKLGNGVVLSFEDITERKNAEKHLQEAHQRLTHHLNNSPLAVIEWDKNFTIRTWSPQAENIFGWSGGEVIGKHFNEFNLVFEEDAPIAGNIAQQLITGAVTQNKGINRNNTKTGKVIYCQWFNSVLKDEKGNVNSILSLIKDITERKKAEAAITASEEKYRTLVEQASDAIFIADSNGNFITVNTSAVKLSQYSEKELLKMSIYDFAIMEDIQKNPFHFDELRQGKTVITERLMKGKHSKPVHVEINAKLLGDGRLLVFVRDISERIKARNEIIKEKNLSDSIIDSLPGVFYLYDRKGNFLRWNKNFSQVTGYSNEEISHMHPLDFFEGEEKELLREKINNVFVAGEDHVEAGFRSKSGKKTPFYFTGKAIDYENESCLMGVGIDISEKMIAQEEIRQTTEQLRQLTTHLQNVREEERKHIAREIHDELGQQLTAVKMDVVWIDKNTGSEAKAVKSKLKNTIDLLDMSNSSIRKILTELRTGIMNNRGLTDAIEWQGKQFSETTGIPVSFSGPAQEIDIEESIANCIFRVYQEALTNITRYAKAGKVKASLTLNRNSIKLVVQDDGKGFDIAMLKHRRSFGILGMKERVSSLNGIFKLTSTPGKGTKISATIPLAPDKNHNK